MDRLLKILSLLLLVSGVSAKSPATDIQKIAYHQMLLLESKMDASPKIWQDMREGYLRGRTVRVCDLVMDSLAMGAEPISLIQYNYPILDSLIIEVAEGKEFDVDLDPEPPTFQVNYFSSSKR